MKKTLFAVLLCVLLFLFMRIDIVKTFVIEEGKRIETEGFIIDSLMPGPTLYVIAGIHGNEPAGVDAAKALKEIDLKKGKLIVLPEANKLALKENARTIPSLGDLNRAFPGVEQGMQVKELAGGIFDHVFESNPDLVLDLHESNHHASEETYAYGKSLIFSDYEGIELLESILIELNDSLSDPYVYYIDEKEGTFNTEAKLLGYTTITFEGDVSEGYDQRVAEQRRFLMIVLEYMGML